MMSTLEDQVSGATPLSLEEMVVGKNALRYTAIGLRDAQSLLSLSMNSKGERLAAGVHHYPAMEMY